MLDHNPDPPPDGDAPHPESTPQGGASLQEPRPQSDNTHHGIPSPRPHSRQRPRLTLQFDAHHGPRHLRPAISHQPHGLYQQAERELQQRNGYAVQTPQRPAPMNPQTHTGGRVVTPPGGYHIPYPQSSPESHAALQRRLAASQAPNIQNGTAGRGSPPRAGFVSYAQGGAENQTTNNHNDLVNGLSLQQSRFGHPHYPQAPNGQQAHLPQNGALNGVPNSHTSTSNDRSHQQNTSEHRASFPQIDGSADGVPPQHSVARPPPIPQNSELSLPTCSPSETTGQATGQVSVFQQLRNNPVYQAPYHRSTPVQIGEQNLGVSQVAGQLNRASNQTPCPMIGPSPGTPQSNLWKKDGDQENSPSRRKATALGKGKSAKKAKTIKTEVKSEEQLLREARDISYALAHPPENAYQSTRLTRSWLKNNFPDHFRGDKRMMKPHSELQEFGPARLNVSATYWKALNEDNCEIRPNMPMHIADRQIVRCDEGHSLEAHSPAGSKSVACVDCGAKSFGNKHNFTTQHMMCAACIGEHEMELSDDSRLEALLKGGAWATLCDECMENCNQFPSCNCEWEKPRCLQHRRLHLEKLSRGNAVLGIQLPLCGHCNERPVSTGTSYAWNCGICSGVFVLPNDIPSTWFPHLDPYKEVNIANPAQKTHQNVVQGLGMILDAFPLPAPGGGSDFDFSYTGSSGTISEPTQPILPGDGVSDVVQTKP